MNLEVFQQKYTHRSCNFLNTILSFLGVLGHKVWDEWNDIHTAIVLRLKTTTPGRVRR